MSRGRRRPHKKTVPTSLGRSLEAVRSEVTDRMHEEGVDGHSEAVTETVARIIIDAMYNSYQADLQAYSGRSWGERDFTVITDGHEAYQVYVSRDEAEQCIDFVPLVLKDETDDEADISEDSN